MKIPSLLLLATAVALAPLSAVANELLVKFDGGIGAIPVSAGRGHGRDCHGRGPGTIFVESRRLASRGGDCRFQEGRGDGQRTHQGRRARPLCSPG